MPETFATFKQNVEKLVHPGGLAKPLRYQFEQDIIQALIYIQRWVNYYKRRNRNVFPFCATYFSCGATVVPKPRGELERLYTLERDCCPVFYDFEQSYDRFTNWLRANRKTWTEPENEGMPELPAPFKYAEDVTDKGKRFNYGFYTFHGEQVWIGHRIESSEKVVIEWTGVRRNWTDDTLMPYDDPEGDEDDKGTELRTAVASYVRSEDLRKNRSNYQGAVLEKQVFDNLVAEMKSDDKRYSTPKAIGKHSEGDFPFDQHITSPCGYDDECAPREEEESVVIANIGDFGDGGEDMQAVAELVEGWGPSWMTTNGDNWYGSSVAPSDFEANGLKFYRDFLYPYMSFEDPKLTSSATLNRFFACIGNHDRDPVGRLEVEMALCNFPKVFRGGQLQASNGYYNVMPISQKVIEHFFFDTGYNNSQVNQQADGVDLNTAQAVWLQTALAQSQARWKVVHMHHPGYTSFETGSSNPVFTGDGYLSYAAMRRIINKLKLWGADLILCGHIHAYERLNVMGLPVIVNGAGGRPIESFGTPHPFSVFRDDTNHGAGRLTVGCNSLLWEFISTDEEVIDELELEKT